MNYYKIEVSDKKTALKIAKSAVSGNPVYYNPFTGEINVRRLVLDIPKENFSIKCHKENPKNVLWILHQMGFKMKFERLANSVLITLPIDKSKRSDIIKIYEELLHGCYSSFFLSLATLHQEHDSILNMTNKVYLSNYSSSQIIEVPNVVNGLYLSIIDD